MQQDDGAPRLYRASVPVFIDVLGLMAATLDRAAAQLGAAGFEQALGTRPGPGMLTAARQVATAAQFTLRIAFPLAGQRAPELRGGFDGPGLADRIAAARAHLSGLDPDAFAGAEARIVRTQAGFADLELDGETYLFRFGLPNLYFHRAMAHVALKQAGARLGKANFDGLHDYPDGFTFG